MEAQLWSVIPGKSPSVVCSSLDSIILWVVGIEWSSVFDGQVGAEIWIPAQENHIGDIIKGGSFEPSTPVIADFDTGIIDYLHNSDVCLNNTPITSFIVFL